MTLGNLSLGKIHSTAILEKVSCVQMGFNNKNGYILKGKFPPRGQALSLQCLEIENVHATMKMSILRKFENCRNAPIDRKMDRGP